MKDNKCNIMMKSIKLIAIITIAVILIGSHISQAMEKINIEPEKVIGSITTSMLELDDLMESIHETLPMSHSYCEHKKGRSVPQRDLIRQCDKRSIIIQ